MARLVDHIALCHCVPTFSCLFGTGLNYIALAGLELACGP